MEKFATKDELNLLRGRIEQLETMCSALRKAMGDLEKKMKSMSKLGGADPDALAAISDELQKLRSDFE